MIRLEYDVNTAGVKVSFIVRDKMGSLKVPDPISEACKLGKNVDGVCTMPQNDKTLEWIKLLAEHAKQENSA